MSLEHQELAMGVRALTLGFEWSSREVRAVAFLLHEVGALNHEEAAWLAGYEGEGAPMTPASPHGPPSDR
jgi:hypothetical protein